jgi:ATP-binding cassette subfamily C (CFTR/MRP) protein 1
VHYLTSCRLDLETELQVQNVIERRFQGKTVISIAHHLSTILHYDLVGFMENGMFVEIGSPRELSQLPEGRFASLLAHSAEKLPQTTPAKVDVE